MTQSEALDVIKSGANVFLTGEPGSGKTHTVNQYIKYLRSRGVEPAITASTGIAATHVNGYTIHSWCGIGVRKWLDKYTLDRIATNERVARRVRKASVLIIDEISMLGPGTLDMVDAVCREVRQSHEPFGGLSVLLVGDFFQLPPVLRASDIDESEGQLLESAPARFAYESGAWQRANFMTCYLTEQFRQDDSVFLNILNAVRRNEFTEEHLRELEGRKITPAKTLRDVPVLYSHNVDVDRTNHDKLRQIESEEKVFEMTGEGPDHLLEALMRGCLSPEKLALKIGAAVMCTKNNMEQKFVNGTLGVVIGFDKVGGYPVIRTRSGRSIVIEPMEWTIEDNGKVRARIRQIPLRLSWAVTVHKSQGMSMDAAVMDLSQAFEYGQGYVALSRVRRLDGLYLLGWNDRAFEVHPEVLERDVEFRRASEEARAAFGRIELAELEKMHKNFVKAVGGKDTAQKVKKSYSLVDIRAKHGNAYAPWGADEDGKLIQFHNSGIGINEIAEGLGREIGAIRSRLRKHGLIT